MKNIQNYISLIIAIVFFVFELVLIKYFHDSTCIHCWIICLFIMFLIIFIGLVISGKGSNVLISFLVPLHNHTGNIAGIFMILFILIQVHLIGTELHEFICCHGSLWHVCLYLMVLLFPFIIQSFFYNNSKLPVPKEDRRVLVLAASEYKYQDLIDINEKFLLTKDGIGFMKEKNKYKALIKTIQEYLGINHVIILVDEKSASPLKEFKEKNSKDFVLEILGLFFPNRFNSNSIEYMPVDNINDFTQMYKVLKPDLEYRIRNYEDREVLFNISSGTSTVSAVLSLFSVIGQRGFCYLEQVDMTQDANARILEFEINAFDLKELWHEILTIVRIKE